MKREERGRTKRVELGRRVRKTKMRMKELRGKLNQLGRREWKIA